MGLLTLSEAKRRVGITDDNNDLLILDLINDVSAMIESYCGRHFSVADYVEYQDGAGDDYFFTNEWPINSITSIYNDLEREFGDTTLVDSTYYTFYADEGRVKLVYDFLYGNLIELFEPGVRNIKITYNAGYTVIPYDLKMIAAEILTKKYKNTMDKRVGMISIGSAGETTVFHLNDMLPEHIKILDGKYRNRGSY
jgi:hypothetical protein